LPHTLAKSCPSGKSKSWWHYNARCW
jgi:hypothetical protein